MDQRKCPHCGHQLPSVVDAFCPNCREPIDEEVPSHQATSNQDGLDRFNRKVLTELLKFRDSSPTFGQMLLSRVPAYLLLIVVFGGLAAASASADAKATSAAYLGILAGMLIRDFFGIKAAVKALKPLLPFIDWHGIEDLIAKSNSTPGEKPADNSIT